MFLCLEGNHKGENHLVNVLTNKTKRHWKYTTQ